MTIPCKKCLLRPFSLEDVPSLAQQADNVKIWRNVRDQFPHPYTQKDAEEFINMSMSADPHTNFAIVIEDKAVGGIGFHPQKDVYRKSAEIGYWLGESYWNKGIMSDALQQFIEFTFTNFDFLRLFAGIFEYNKASMRILEKAGFKLEGILEKAVIKEGKILDEYRYALIRDAK